MILTGNEIRRQVESGGIVIDPFIPESLNPNSYNFRLSDKLLEYAPGVIDPKVPHKTRVIEIDESGFELEPRKLYLASTMEKMGSANFVPTYNARSSIARLGLFINLSAALGDIGFIGNWTIQLYATHRVKLYPGILIGQICFWKVMGPIELYDGKYQGADGVIASRIQVDIDKKLPQKKATPVP